LHKSKTIKGKNLNGILKEVNKEISQINYYKKDYKLHKEYMENNNIMSSI